MSDAPAKVLLLSGWLVLALTASCSPPGTKGTIPPPGPNGEVNASLAPDFIAVAGPEAGIAGYTPKECVFPEVTRSIGPPDEPACPVYGDDLRTLVGHMIPNKGFVPIGVDPGTVPDRPVAAGPSLGPPDPDGTGLTLYVRNGAGRTAWFAVVPTGQPIGAGAMGALGFDGTGVGCLDVPFESQLVFVDQPPQNPAAGIVRVLYRAVGANQQPVLWVDVAADGAVAQGLGLPAWWPDGPQAC